MNASRIRSPLVGIIKALVALGLAEGLRTLLSIPSGPLFDPSFSWGPILGWLIIVSALLSLMDRILYFFRRIPDAKPDVYTRALVERQAERFHHHRTTREPHLP